MSFECFLSRAEQFEIEYKIQHEGDVKCARVMPQNVNIIASKSDYNLFIYDIGKIDEMTATDGKWFELSAAK